MKKLLSAALILAMAITAVGCSDNDRQGGPVAETTKIEDKDTSSDPTDDKADDITTNINIDVCHYLPPFVSVESSFSRSDIIVRGICRAVDDHSFSRDYLFDVIEVYDGNYTETTISVHESIGGVERPESLYEVGKEYYLPLKFMCDEIDMSDPTAPIYLGDFENVYNLSLPIHEPQEQFVLVYEAQEQLVLRDTPISEYAREETVLALSSPDTAAEYFRTRRFSEINAEQIAEEARSISDNAD